MLCCRLLASFKLLMLEIAPSRRVAYIKDSRTKLDYLVTFPIPNLVTRVNTYKGGAWFLSSLSGNNWPTVSFLRDNLWDSFQFSLLLPANVLDVNQYPEVIADVAAKKLAGFDNTIVDPYGRLLSYQLLEGEDGGDDIRLSTLTSLSNFTSFNVPYPIITALGVDNAYQGQCFPTIDSTQWEFHPYEYGSWDAGVSAFATTQYMGSALTNGQPTNPNECIQHYDNIGYIFGTSSNIFVGTCAAIEPDSSNNASLPAFLSSIVSRTQRPTFQDKFGIYPNPFFQYPQSPLVQENTLLTLADGGLAGQNVPIWPFITGPRKVDILIASDNSADTSENFPNGTEIRQTYLNAQARNLTRMPYIPPVSEFTLKNLTNRAVFFGCESLSSSNEEEQQQQQETLLLIWLPNVAYTYPSNQPTSKIQYSQEETRGMIENGNAIATQNGDAEWPFCLACGIKARDAELPEECEACFEKYCYRRNGGGGIEGMRNN